MPPTCLRKYFRVAKEDLAFVYAILESYEGLMSYSTQVCLHPHLHRHRYLQTIISPSFLEESKDLFQQLGAKLYELEKIPEPC